MIRPIFALISLISLSVTASAAEKFPTFEEVVIGYRASIITEPAVVNELKLDEGKRKEIAAVLAQAAKDYDAALPKNVPGDPATFRAEKAKLIVKTRAGVNQAIEKLLTEEQVKRLRGLELHQMGLDAFYEEQVRKLVKATPEQSAKIDKILRQYEIDMGRKRRRASGIQVDRTIAETEIPLAGARPDVSLSQLKREAMLAIKNALKQDQWELWLDALGKPYPTK